MIKSDELKGPSCLTNAADDEPIFVLRANDELAPTIVRQWAYSYRGTKLREGIYTAQRAAKFDEALQLASAMEDWRRTRTENRPRPSERGACGAGAVTGNQEQL